MKLARSAVTDRGSAVQQQKLFGVMDDNQVAGPVSQAGFNVIKKTVWIVPTNNAWDNPSNIKGVVPLPQEYRDSITSYMADAKAHNEAVANGTARVDVDRDNKVPMTQSLADLLPEGLHLNDDAAEAAAPAAAAQEAPAEAAAPAAKAPEAAAKVPEAKAPEAAAKAPAAKAPEARPAAKAPEARPAAKAPAARPAAKAPAAKAPAAARPAAAPVAPRPVAAPKPVAAKPIPMPKPMAKPAAKPAGKPAAKAATKPAAKPASSKSAAAADTQDSAE